MSAWASLTSVQLQQYLWQWMHYCQGGEHTLMPSKHRTDGHLRKPVSASNSWNSGQSGAPAFSSDPLSGAWWTMWFAWFISANREKHCPFPCVLKLWSCWTGVYPIKFRSQLPSGTPEYHSQYSQHAVLPGLRMGVGLSNSSWAITEMDVFASFSNKICSLFSWRGCVVHHFLGDTFLPWMKGLF